MMASKILIAEDHDLYRDGLRHLVMEIFPDAKIVEASDFYTASEQLILHPDLSLLILDIQLPGTQRLDGVKQLRGAYPLLPIVVVSALEMGPNVQNVMALGVNGFIAKSAKKHEMQEGLLAILRGELVTVTQCHDQLPSFSPRHLETLEYLTQGLSNKEIARNLGISDITVRQYVSDIIDHLGVENRTQAVMAAKKRGIIID
ncbi:MULTISPECIES: response regulator transcription factor [unclassified Hahella]|uniref:response regulator transcription factor n=1 Tax=unclassified Hahella TaxID=2624107 RepID=UPI001C1EA881|nr:MULTISPECIES: response regulator transcription factor [unclassified Hahella]MBU6952112.1 response regulator transcription factor [Hahella sp. HN01]MDG9670113.1 response regulator transcription factor [Hahella sp. CR1]